MQAVGDLQAEGLSPRLELLDVRDDTSVKALADTIAERHGGVDIVISNAAARISREIPSEQQVRTFVDTNNHGMLRVIRAFRPLLNDGARFIVVASSFGTLGSLDPRLHPRFDVAHMSLADLAKVMNDYVEAVETGRAAAEGWPGWINPPSKVGQVAAVKVLARELAGEAARRDILVNAACPGLSPPVPASPMANSSSTARSFPSRRRLGLAPGNPSQPGRTDRQLAARERLTPPTPPQSAAQNHRLGAAPKTTRLRPAVRCFPGHSATSSASVINGKSAKRASNPFRPISFA